MRTLLTGALALALAAGTALAEDKVVNVYNWSDYIDESLLEEFTKETGIKVVYDVFDSNDLLETKLLAGASGYDVVVPSGNFLSRQIQAGVFAKLDKSKLPNIVNMWDVVTKRTDMYDPNGEHSVNYMWGTSGIGYNVAEVKKRLGTDTIDSWSVFYDPETLAKFADCGVYVLDAPEDVLAWTMNYQGKPGDSKEPADLEAAAALMMKLRPSIKTFSSSAYIEALANGDACLALGYSGDMIIARTRAEEAKNGIQIGYSIPKEGAQMWFDQMAIPADAKHKDEALAFINFMMKPESIAKASNYVFYANGNKAAQPLMDPAILSDPTIYPPEATLEKLYVLTPHGPKTQRLITRLWTTIKTGS